jgi:hypothetical protein
MTCYSASLFISRRDLRLYDNNLSLVRSAGTIIAGYLNCKPFRLKLFIDGISNIVFAIILR